LVGTSQRLALRRHPEQVEKLKQGEDLETETKAEHRLIH
jgi:hypothetical protein